MALHKPEHTTWWYWASWPFLALGFLLVWPFCFLLNGWEWTRQGWLRDWENWIDDPIDWIKEWLHCHPIPFTNRVLNISFLMMNRKTTWNIFAYKDEVDCDPEDQ